MRIRRDIQRLVVMTRGEAVPPSPLLDEAWQRFPETRVAVVRQVSLLGLGDEPFLAALVATSFERTTRT